VPVLRGNGGDKKYCGAKRFDFGHLPFSVLVWATNTERQRQSEHSTSLREAAFSDHAGKNGRGQLKERRE